MSEKNQLYPPEGKEATFEDMEKAIRMVVNKDKEYPTQQFTGIGGIAKAVYANRIFPFRFKGLFRAKRGKILGGMYQVLGAFYRLWYIIYKEGVEYEYEFIWPNGWKLDPTIITDKYKERVAQLIVLPLCWLETI